MYRYKNIILYGLRSCSFNSFYYTYIMLSLIRLIIESKLRLEVGSFDKRFIFFKKKKKKILSRIQFFHKHIGSYVRSPNFWSTIQSSTSCLYSLKHIFSQCFFNIKKVGARFLPKKIYNRRRETAYVK
jgi:hypothetical protein